MKDKPVEKDLAFDTPDNCNVFFAINRSKDCAKCFSSDKRVFQKRKGRYLIDHCALGKVMQNNFCC